MAVKKMAVGALPAWRPGPVLGGNAPTSGRVVAEIRCSKQRMILTGIFEGRFFRVRGDFGFQARMIVRWCPHEEYPFEPLGSGKEEVSDG